MKNKKQIFQNSPEFEVEKRRIITLDKLLNKGDFSTVIKEGKKYMKDHVELPFVHTAVSLA